jgi:DNA-directed RNA polymerase specialized sigma subunit
LKTTLARIARGNNRRETIIAGRREGNNEHTDTDAGIINSVVNTGWKPVPYLNNKDLLLELALSKCDGRITNKLAKMMILLVERYSNKPNFRYYTYAEDMRSYALTQLVRGWGSFNPERSSNAFAYLTQIAHNAFLKILKKEKQNQVLRDELLLASNQTPSYSYQLDEEDKQRPLD